MDLKTYFGSLCYLWSFVFSLAVWCETGHQNSTSPSAVVPAGRPIAVTPSPQAPQDRKGRWYNGVFEYQNEKGEWVKPLLSFRSDRAGSFLTREGITVDYSSGDFLFKTTESGWLKAEKNIPVVQEEVQDNPTLPNPQGVELSDIEREVIQLTNQERMKRGLPALVVSGPLLNLSRQKSTNMARTKNLSHSVAPRPPGGENIAWNQANAKEVVRSWMNSDGHRANILSRRYSTIGVGMALGNGPYWTQMFQ
ncbi:CAP domain-containing protein [bacterium]|nr:CAP domain-containing protein [bacterium]